MVLVTVYVAVRVWKSKQGKSSHRTVGALQPACGRVDRQVCSHSCGQRKLCKILLLASTCVKSFLQFPMKSSYHSYLETVSEVKVKGELEKFFQLMQVGKRSFQ